MIDGETKDRLIREDPSSVDLIKPFLAGRDIKRYQVPKTDSYLILVKNGQTNEMRGKKDPWEWLSETYPAVANYLSQFEEKAKARYDQGEYWWELRACSYYNEFEKPKIIYPNICKRPEYTFDDEFKFTNQKCFIISLEDKFLLAYMNSTLMHFLYEQVLPKLRGDFYEPSYVYLKDFPVPKKSDKLAALADQILTTKKDNPDADTSKLEAEIDRLVYELYGLSEEEIGVIENSST